MKNIITAAVAAAFAVSTLAFSVPTIADTPSPSSPSQQQSQGSGGHQGHNGIREALEQLNLTSDQKAQIKGILKASKPKVDAIKQDATLTADQKKAQIKAIRRDADQQIMAVLTPAQQQQFKDWMKSHRGNKGGGGGANNGVQNTPTSNGDNT